MKGIEFFKKKGEVMNLNDKDYNIRFIQRFIEFCYADLNDAPWVEIKKKWWIESLFVIGSLPRGMETPWAAFEITEKDWAMVLLCQKKIAEFLNWFFEHLDEELVFKFEVPYQFRWSSKNMEKYFEYSPLVSRYEISESGNEDSLKGMVKISVYRYGYDRVHEEDVVFPIGAANFMEALNDLPTSSLLKCPLCGKIFFNSSKRKKVYCSKRCQNTAGVQRLRERKEND